MFFLGFFVGAALVAVFNLAKKLDDIKKWNDNDESNG